MSFSVCVHSANPLREICYSKDIVPVGFAFPIGERFHRPHTEEPVFVPPYGFDFTSGSPVSEGLVCEPLCVVVVLER